MWGGGALPEGVLEETFQIASGTGRNWLDEVLEAELWRCTWTCRGVGLRGGRVLAGSVLEETFQVASGTSQNYLDDVLGAISCPLWSPRGSW